MTVVPRRHLLSLIFLILIGTLASVLLQNSRPMWRDATGSAAADRIGREDTSPEVIWGKSELTVITFPDYQCPACRRASPALQSAAKRDGNVRIVYKDWPVFGERSVRAASIVLEAHEQQLYVPVHEKLMNLRSFEDDGLREAVMSAGADWNEIKAGLVHHRISLADQLSANRADAFALRLRGALGYLIGSLIVEGGLTEQEFLDVFEEARSKA